MLSAKRKSDGQTVTAYMELKPRGPYICLVCGDEVILRTGRCRINHFAHENPLACFTAQNETETHRRCKMEIYEELQREPDVQNVVLERPLDSVRPDVSAYVRGVPVAIEVQISSLSLESITDRTIHYARKGIYVLWLLPWTPKLDAARYSPSQWEKWLHAAYFGRVYYWMEGLTVVAYRFEPHLMAVRQQSWYAEDGKKMNAGGYSRRSKRHRTPVRGSTFHLVRDFAPKQRDWWEGNGVKVPAARLFMER
jgi:competence protein CoiA